MIDVVRIETPTLGDRSYLVHDGEVGLVVDPQRDIDRITALAARLGVRITHVAETHMHNDYVSGGLALSRACGASYLVGAAEPASFARTPVSDGDSIDVSDAFRDTGGRYSRPYLQPPRLRARNRWRCRAGVFTGGSLLFGSTGRTDLLGADHAAALARAQHASARRLARELPDSAEVFPTHGFGSFCAATQAAGQSSTIGQEKLANHALTLDEEAYVEALLAGLDAWPAYYAQMGAINLAGAAAPDLTPPRPASAAQLRRADRRRRMGRRPAGPGRLRRRLPAGLGQLPAGRQPRHLPGLAAPARGAGHPARRDAGAGRAGAAGTGQDRDRPAGRRGHRDAQGLGGRPAAGVPAPGQVQRPGGGHGPPRRHLARGA